MKLFHLYNNGVTITATGWAYRDNQKALEIRDPAVINGCQTVRTLARVKKELEEDAESTAHALKAFDETCLVLVRLIKKDVVDLDEIVRAANTQNAMEPRNLLSNRTEQRQLEKELAELNWFYERKDGSVDALREMKRTSLGIRLAVQAIDATLRQPEYQASFLSSERKSRYVQSDQLLRAYAEKVDQYDKYFTEPGNFTKWWSGGSPIKALRDFCLAE